MSEKIIDLNLRITPIKIISQNINKIVPFIAKSYLFNYLILSIYILNIYIYIYIVEHIRKTRKILVI